MITNTMQQDVLQTKTYDVFISYRRKTALKEAWILKDALSKYGLKVFFDIDILPGTQFEERIPACIGNSTHFISVLTPGCFDRCRDPKDWVRREIEEASNKKKDIIVINIDGRFNFHKEVLGLPDIVKEAIYKRTCYTVYLNDSFDARINEIIVNRIGLRGNNIFNNNYIKQCYEILMTASARQRE